jgi:alpha-N-acetylglucosamine transferase
MKSLVYIFMNNKDKFKSKKRHGENSDRFLQHFSENFVADVTKTYRSLLLFTCRDIVLGN